MIMNKAIKILPISLLTITLIAGILSLIALAPIAWAIFFDAMSAILS